MSEIPTQYFGIQLSALCSLLPRPLILTGLFRDILTKHFANGRTEEPSLRNLLWQESESSPIVIESVYRWRPELTEKRPGVMIKRTQYTNDRVGIGDQRMGVLTELGNQQYATMWQGGHVLYCIGGSGAEAEILATEVHRHLTEFAPIIAPAVKLMRLQVQAIGEVAILEESKQNFVVPVSVSYIYEQNWEIIPQVPRLNRISVAADVLLEL